MIAPIVTSTKKSQDLWRECKAPIQVKSLINQLTLDTQVQMDKGEWDFAVKLGYYRHEIAKLYNSTDWYEPFIEIRKTRDSMDLLAGPVNDNRT
jgi:hypothetical protein